MYRSTRFLSIIGMVMLLFAASASAQDLEGIVKSYLEAHNSHNIDAAVAFFTADAVFEEEGINSYAGTAELREKELWDKAVNSVMELRQLKVQGNKVTAVGVEYSDYYRAAGVPEYRYDSVEIEFKNGKISKVLLIPSSDSSNTFANALNSFVVWASNPSNGVDMNRLKVNGSWAFTDTTANAWVELLDKWKTASNQ